MSCPGESKDVLDYLVAVAPIFVSGAVAWIAWAQYKTNKSKLKLDLYNRRFAVYDKTLSYYLAYMATEKNPIALSECATEFVRAYRESVFLFGTDSAVYEALTKIKDTLGFLIGYDEKFSSKPYDRDEYTAWSKIRESKPDLTKQMELLELALLPWLDFRKVES